MLRMFVLAAMLLAAPCTALAQGLTARLWTPEQLAAQPGESRSGPLTAPDAMSPGTTRLERQAPPPAPRPCGARSAAWTPAGASWWP